MQVMMWKQVPEGLRSCGIPTKVQHKSWPLETMHASYSPMYLLQLML